MPHSPTDLLTLGLQKGFGGDTNMATGNRAGFAITSSHYQDPATGDVYHDEWAADRAGGGQELVKVGEQRFTRVYAGGTISYEALQRLGITKQEVMAFLIKQIQALGGATRLHESCGPVMDGDWEYEYELKERDKSIPLTVGKESIRYKNELVFVHGFMLTEVG